MISRIKVLFIFFIVGFLALSLRLFYWQIVEGKDLAKKAILQYRSREILNAPRGNIIAADSTWLAATQQGWLLYAQLTDLKKKPADITSLISPLLPDVNQEKMVSLLQSSKLGVNWVPLVHKISNSTKEKIEELNLSGLGFEEENFRLYPEGSSSAQLLGFVGKDSDGSDKGYFGLEGFYNQSLQGKTGFSEGERDARGGVLANGANSEIQAVGGVDLVTSIDKTFQLIAEKKLKEGIEKYGAVSGTVVILDPNDGSVLAMVAYPSYDPANYFNFESESFKNPVVSDSFEPGSIFKPIIMASALDAGVINPLTVCDICNGPVKIDKYSIETWDNKYHPDSTMTDVIVHSDNVGMTFVGKKLGVDKLFQYLQKFGIGKSTGIDLQGEENPGIRDENNWNSVDLATATFGQGIAVTPIQMVRAISVLANGGYLIKPHVVSALKKDDWISNYQEANKVQVISENAANEIKSMMIDAVKNGESKWTQARGFKIAGKTGTAQIPVSGHYDDKKTIASFVGFAPADKPKFVMLVTLREPKTSQWGSETAAPLWFNIASNLFVYLGIQPES